MYSSRAWIFAGVSVAGVEYKRLRNKPRGRTMAVRERVL
jgi:hypothetical protein